jgi:hypothetical protein
VVNDHAVSMVRNHSMRFALGISPVLCLGKDIGDLQRSLDR